MCTIGQADSHDWFFVITAVFSHLCGRSINPFVWGLYEVDLILYKPIIFDSSEKFLLKITTFISYDMGVYSAYGYLCANEISRDVLCSYVS